VNQREQVAADWIEELCEAVFSVGPCRGYIWIIESQSLRIEEPTESAVNSWETITLVEAWEAKKPPLF
jgi:hypothetical protein